MIIQFYSPELRFALVLKLTLDLIWLNLYEGVLN